MDQPSVAIVTGASSGLGRSFALELNRMGTAIVAVARRRHELAETAALVTDAGGRCQTVVADVTSPGAAAEAIAAAEAAFGPVDLLVSNAGDVYLALKYAFYSHYDLRQFVEPAEFEEFEALIRSLAKAPATSAPDSPQRKSAERCER